MHLPDPPATVASLEELIRWGAQHFATAELHFGHGTDNAYDEAAWLALHALALDLDALATATQTRLDGSQITAVAELYRQRIATRQPAAYLTHQAWFAGHAFYVDDRVLVPRSHVAEIIADRFAPWIDPDKVSRILDLGTGSGCIAIAAALAFPQAAVDASDVSTDALAVARINVDHFDLGARIRLLHADVYDGLDDERYDVIITNPPYVEEERIGAFPAEYLHEPHLALAAGPQGLDVVARILTGASAHLTARGVLIAEVGDNRALVEASYPQLPFTWLATSYGDVGVFVLSAADLARVGDLGDAPKTL